VTYVARPATPEDVIFVAENLRQADRIETETASGKPAVTSLLEALINSSETYAAVLSGDSTPFMLFGVSPDPVRPEYGVVWLLATDRVKAAPLMVVQGAAEWLNKWAQKYRVLHNLVDTRNRLHLRWLKLLGFSFGSTVKIRGQAFRHFYRHSEDHPNV
jgi:hypothetical protein